MEIEVRGYRRICDRKRCRRTCQRPEVPLIITALPLPVVGAFHPHQLTECHARADETTWKVFEPVFGKDGNRWYLWMFRTKTSIVFRMVPGRGADAPMEYYTGLLVERVLIRDHCCACRKMARIIGSCWLSTGLIGAGISGI